MNILIQCHAIMQWIIYPRCVAIILNIVSANAESDSFSPHFVLEELLFGLKQIFRSFKYCNSITQFVRTVTHWRLLNQRLHTLVAFFTYGKFNFARKMCLWQFFLPNKNVLCSFLKKHFVTCNWSHVYFIPLQKRAAKISVHHKSDLSQQILNIIVTTRM